MKSNSPYKENRQEINSSLPNEYIDPLLNFLSTVSQGSSEKTVLAIAFMSLIAFLATGFISLLVFYIGSQSIKTAPSPQANLSSKAMQKIANL